MPTRQQKIQKGKPHSGQIKRITPDVQPEPASQVDPGALPRAVSDPGQASTEDLLQIQKLAGNQASTKLIQSKSKPIQSLDRRPGDIIQRNGNDEDWDTSDNAPQEREAVTPEMMKRVQSGIQKMMTSKPAPKDQQKPPEPEPGEQQQQLKQETKQPSKPSLGSRIKRQFAGFGQKGFYFKPKKVDAKEDKDAKRPARFGREQEKERYNFVSGELLTLSTKGKLSTGERIRMERLMKQKRRLEPKYGDKKKSPRVKKLEDLWEKRGVRKGMESLFERRAVAKKEAKEAEDEEDKEDKNKGKEEEQTEENEED